MISALLHAYPVTCCVLLYLKEVWQSAASLQLEENVGSVTSTSVFSGSYIGLTLSS